MKGQQIPNIVCWCCQLFTWTIYNVQFSTLTTLNQLLCQRHFHSNMLRMKMTLTTRTCQFSTKNSYRCMVVLLWPKKRGWTPKWQLSGQLSTNNNSSLRKLGKNTQITWKNSVQLRVRRNKLQLVRVSLSQLTQPQQWKKIYDIMIFNW